MRAVRRIEKRATRVYRAIDKSERGINYFVILVGNRALMGKIEMKQYSWWYRYLRTARTGTNFAV